MAAACFPAFFFVFFSFHLLDSVTWFLHRFFVFRACGTPAEVSLQVSVSSPASSDPIQLTLGETKYKFPRKKNNNKLTFTTSERTGPEKKKKQKSPQSQSDQIRSLHFSLLLAMFYSLKMFHTSYVAIKTILFIYIYVIFYADVVMLSWCGHQIKLRFSFVNSMKIWPIRVLFFSKRRRARKYLYLVIFS